MGILSGLWGKRSAKKPATKLTPAQRLRELEEKIDQELKKHTDDLLRASKNAEDALKRFHEKQHS
jgi:hypothetical protein